MFWVRDGEEEGGGGGYFAEIEGCPLAEIQGFL